MDSNITNDIYYKKYLKYKTKYLLLQKELEQYGAGKYTVTQEINGDNVTINFGNLFTYQYHKDSRDLLKHKLLNFYDNTDIIESIDFDQLFILENPGYKFNIPDKDRIKYTLTKTKETYSLVSWCYYRSTELRN